MWREPNEIKSTITIELRNGKIMVCVGDRYEMDILFGWLNVFIKDKKVLSIKLEKIVSVYLNN